MPHTVRVTRTRMQIEAAYVNAVTAALATGTPLVTPGPAHTLSPGVVSARNLLYRQFFNRSHFRFDQLGYSERDQYTVNEELPELLTPLFSADHRVCLEYTTFDYTESRGGVHACAVLWRAPVGTTLVPDTICFDNKVGVNHLYATTRPNGVADLCTSAPTPTDDELAYYIFAGVLPGRSVNTHFVHVLNTAEVVECVGPAIDDPIWSTMVPDTGTDLAFDTEFGGVISAEYTLIRKTYR